MSAATLRAFVIAQTLAEVQAEARRLRREAETWPAFDRAHAVLAVFERAAGFPVEEMSKSE